MVGVCDLALFLNKFCCNNGCAGREIVNYMIGFGSRLLRT